MMITMVLKDSMVTSQSLGSFLKNGVTSMLITWSTDKWYALKSCLRKVS